MVGITEDSQGGRVGKREGEKVRPRGRGSEQNLKGEASARRLFHFRFYFYCAPNLLLPFLDQYG